MARGQEIYFDVLEVAQLLYIRKDKMEYVICYDCPPDPKMTNNIFPNESSSLILM